MRKIECSKCGRMIAYNAIGQHLQICYRVPRPEEMAEMLDDDPALTVNGLCQIFDVSDSFIKRHLKGTGWNNRRLRQRGRNAHKYRPNLPIIRPGHQCPRCGLLTESKLCEYCLEEIKEKISGRVSFRSWDLPYIVGLAG